jgi:hypothetical protein
MAQFLILGRHFRIKAVTFAFSMRSSVFWTNSDGSEIRFDQVGPEFQVGSY